MSKYKEVGVRFMKAIEYEDMIREEGEDRFGKLTLKLLESGRINEIEKSLKNKKLRDQIQRVCILIRSTKPKRNLYII